MAILPNTLQRELEDSTKGPRPISIEDYRKRRQQSQQPKQEFQQQPTDVIAKKKTRGGVQVKLRKEIGNLHRLILIADKSNKRNFLQHLKKLQRQLKSHKQIKRSREIRDVNNVLGHGKERSRC